MTCTVCENCEEKIFTNRVQEPHDCIATLKANLKAAREEIKALEDIIENKALSGEIAGGGDIGARLA